MNQLAYRSVDVDGVEVFYREARLPGAPKLLLLHGFPTSSHMFRDLMPRLTGYFDIVAPDLPGFGRSGDPRRNTFESIAATMRRFTGLIGFERYVVYVFDYGAPIGFRLALQDPGRVAGIVSQNGNAYVDGLSDAWRPVRSYWEEPTAANREALTGMLEPKTTLWQYMEGVPEPCLVSPDGYALDDFYMGRPGRSEIQLDLLGDYRSNVALYPEFQSYFREHAPRLLAVWGRHDPFFLPVGAEAFRRDLPDARVVLLETGHFALETHSEEIATEIRSFFY